MKKQGLLILFLLCISVTLFIVFTKADNNYDEEILEIGEEKYLKFLWMVDGAFNEKRMDGEFTINGKKLNKDNISFTCEYMKKNKETCIGNNFLEEFNSLFSQSIIYSDVYGDGMTFSWIKHEDNKFYFTNPNNCNINRMNLEQTLSIKEVNDDRIIYRVSYQTNNYKHPYNANFVLVKENNDWKRSEANYYDLCEMEYHIE